MRKKASILSLVCICLISIVVLAACGTPHTVERYSNNHPEFVDNINKQFKENGFQSDVTIKENNININIDMSDKFKDVEVTEALKDTVKKAFNQSFDYMASDMAAYISEVQETSKAKNVKMKVTIISEGDVLAEYEFDENSETVYEK